MALFDWLWRLLYRFGFLRKSASILLLGLDNAGKTTLLNKLKYGWIRSFIPTQRAQLEEVSLGNITFRAWDVGGHQQVRNLWRDYCATVEAIIFVVDASDEDRFGEVQQELLPLLTDDNLNGTIFVILGNKTDQVPTLSLDEFVHNLNLTSVLNDAQHLDRAPIKVFMSSIVQEKGYTDAFDWLSSTI